MAIQKRAVLMLAGWATPSRDRQYAANRSE
jgi:hypothetical protein